MQEVNSPVLQAIFQRRSIRKYTDAPVSRDDLVTMLEAARWAPSGSNRQPWRFLVMMQGDKRKDALSDMCAYKHIIDAAGALILVVTDQEACRHPVKDHQSVGAALQNMLLAAHDLGLGAVWIGQIMDRKREVMAVLHQDPDRFDFMALVAVGHPAEQGRPPQRIALADLLLEPF